jgi:hypothetical protein
MPGQEANRTGSIALLLIGTALICGGLLVLFGLAVEVIHLKLWVALLAFAATFAGMVIGIIGLERIVRPRPPEEK